MTRIDFYILQDVAVPAMHRFACRLASKAIGSGQSVIMHTADEASARELDELLWHYPDRRFLPHDVQAPAPASRGESVAPDATPAPLTISWQEPVSFDGVLINLTADVPDFFNRFHRVVEVVVGATRDQGRERYKFYRHRGYPLYDHHLEDWEAEQAAS